VPGDVVIIDQGDKCPADIRLVKLNSIRLVIEQMSLTGESANVSKTTK
jgi:P-type E1-E2 ATPase